MASFAYVAALVAFAGYYLWPSIYRTWFFSSDEYDFAAEVIRFLGFSFKQHFFDMPGTPFMFAVAALWAIWYLMCRLAGLGHEGVVSFAFHHLPALFALMRATTVIFIWFH